MEKPFFSARMLRTDPQGNDEQFAGTDRVSAFDDHIEISKQLIPYRDLIELRLFDKVVHFVIVTPEGRRMERYFKYESFLPGRDRKALKEIHQRIASIMNALPATEFSGSASSPSLHPQRKHAGRAAELLTGREAGGRWSPARPQPRGAEAMGQSWGRHKVGVFSSLIAFPAICPKCCAPAESIMTIQQPGSALRTERPNWLVPTCRKHRRATRAISAERRNSPGDPWVFKFTSPEYALAFLNLNEVMPEDRDITAALDSPLFEKLESGVRFVVFQCAFGLIYMSLLLPSSVYEIPPRGGTLLRSLPFTWISCVMGWWAIPTGPIFTISAIVRNTRGGVDVTQDVRRVLFGQ